MTKNKGKTGIDTSANFETTRAIYKVHMDLINEPADAARADIDDKQLEELAASIKSQGLLQPIGLVLKEGRYEIIWGHRRFLAHKILRRAHIDAVILDVKEKELIINRFIENSGRVDVSIIEEALQLSTLKETYNMSAEQIAKKVGRSPAWVTGRLSVLHWDDNLITALQLGKIKYSAARELSRVKNPAMLKLLLDTTINNGAAPGVVKRWVDDAIHEEVDEENYEAPREEIILPPENKMVGETCHYCLENKSFNHLRSIWVCRECDGTLKRVIEAHDD